MPDSTKESESDSFFSDLQGVSDLSGRYSDLQGMSDLQGVSGYTRESGSDSFYSCRSDRATGPLNESSRKREAV